MKKLMIALVLVGFAATISIASAGPDKVTLEAKNGNVTFNHAGHSAKMDCATCHGAGTPAKLELDKNSGHALCKDCHKNQGQGPTKCKECHVK